MDTQSFLSSLQKSYNVLSESVQTRTKF